MGLFLLPKGLFNFTTAGGRELFCAPAFMRWGCVRLPSPGAYALELREGRGGMRLELRLCPGANVDLVLDPVSQQACWRRDPFHYFYNSPAGT